METKSPMRGRSGKDWKNKIDETVTEEELDTILEYGEEKLSAAESALDSLLDSVNATNALNNRNLKSKLNPEAPTFTAKGLFQSQSNLTSTSTTSNNPFITVKGPQSLLSIVEC